MRRPLWLLFILSTLPALASADAVPTYDRVTLSEHASTEVQNDLMVAVLFAEYQGLNASPLAEKVNRDITAALSRARNTPGIEVSTRDYRTRPIYDKNGALKGWQVSQSVRLESTDGKVLGDLLGTLQQHLKLESIGYQVSPQQRREHIDSVIQVALKRFQERAQLVADAFGKSHWRLVRLTVNDGGPRPMPVVRARMMSEAAVKSAPPVPVEAGTATLEVSVNGEIELSD
jgi:predicted secreted protein